MDVGTNGDRLCCIACNKLQPRETKVCQCGHLMSEAVDLVNKIVRKRKAPNRPNSISSEWIGLSLKLSDQVKVITEKPQMMKFLKLNFFFASLFSMMGACFWK